jgi:endonuclease/exonuclease/phosphatase family metal-dependent hydrolase
MMRRPAAMMLSAVGGGLLIKTPAPGVCLQESPGAPMRIITYNTMRFKARDGSSTEAAIGDALAGLQPTIVALNEVDIRLRPAALPALAERLGGFYFAFFGHVRGQYGNALLSKYPIKAIRETHLRGGTEVSFPPGTKKFNGEIAKEGEVHRIARGLLECDIELPPTADGPGRLITVAVTHLDHISEEQRRIQLTHLLEAIEPSKEHTVVVGDLNALQRSDYAEHEWGALEKRAEDKGWSAPTSGCLSLLADAGFLDAFAQSRNGDLSARTQPHEDPIFSAHVGHPLYRIDYCFVTARLGFKPSGAKVHTEITLSDHYPVSFDFIMPPAGSRL